MIVSLWFLCWTESLTHYSRPQCMFGGLGYLKSSYEMMLHSNYHVRIINDVYIKYKTKLFLWLDDLKEMRLYILHACRICTLNSQNVLLYLAWNLLFSRSLRCLGSFFFTVRVRYCTKNWTLCSDEPIFSFTTMFYARPNVVNIA